MNGRRTSQEIADSALDADRMARAARRRGDSEMARIWERERDQYARILQNASLNN